MENVKIAIAKGRTEEQAINLLDKAGIDTSILRNKGRKLILSLPESGLEFILLKAVDVPTYVERGVVDMGIVGKDVLMEQGKQLYEVVDLEFGKCKLSVAGKEDGMVCKKHLRVATKYPNVAGQYFAAKGQSVEIIRQEGSVELAPLVDLSDIIVDIVETGNTLRENGLVVLEDIANISARLVVNRVSLKTKMKRISSVIDAISKVVNQEESLWR